MELRISQFSQGYCKSSLEKQNVWVLQKKTFLVTTCNNIITWRLKYCIYLAACNGFAITVSSIGSSGIALNTQNLKK